METQIIRISCEDIDEEIMTQAGQVIQNGGLVAFPTETVYGLGGNALNRESSRRIYEAKGRPSDNPLIVHISSMEALSAIAEEIKEPVYRLAEAFWPGPLTMVLKKTKLVPSETTGGLDTVAVRMPSHPVALKFIEAAGGYVAAPSANRSGRPSPTKAKYVIEDMQGRIDMILDGDGIDIGLESTIVDMTGELPMILRPGYITKDMLTKVVGEVLTDRTILDVNCKDRPKAPGMRYRHYAPKGSLTILEGEPELVTERIRLLSRQAAEAGEKVGIIATDETGQSYSHGLVKSVGSRQDEEMIARSLYTILREFDDEDVTVIYSESFSDSGFGQAIMNRLLKAAGHQVDKV